MQSPHVLFVLEYFPPHVGGVETLFATLARGLAAEGYRATVVTLHLPGTPTHERVDGVRVVRVRVPPVAVRYLFTLFALPAVLRHAARADLVHTTTYNAAIPAWIAAALRRKPAIITVHEVFGAQWHTLPGLNRWLGYGFRAYEWAVLHLPFTRYIAVSRFTRGRLVRLLGARAAARTDVVYNPIDEAFWLAPHAPHALHRELGLPPETFVALYAGRPGISKGVEYLIDAAVRVRAALPESRLVLILARDPLDQYERLLRRIAERDLEEYVIVRDSVPRAALPGYLLGAGCVVVPSVSEGFGYFAVEAATLGCPVIATSGHSVEEIIGESVTLVPPQNAAALAEAIIAVARHRPALPPPPRFTVAAYVAGVRAVYAQINPAFGHEDGDVGDGSVSPPAPGRSSR